MQGAVSVMKLENALQVMPSLNRMNGSHIKGNDEQIKQATQQPEDNHHMKKIKGKEVENAVNKFNGFINPFRTNLKFEFHEKLNEYYVQVVNPLTDKILREIPPKEMLDMYASMAEFMRILIDEKR